MLPVFRAKVLTAFVALLLALLSPAGAAAGSTSPGGVLTHAEYQELLAVQKELSRAGQSAKPSRVCRALTGLSRLTATQHSECLVEVPFFAAFLNFDHAVAHCEKGTNLVASYRCIYEVVDGLYKDTAAFARADRASTAAATQRGLTGKCLDDLVFTPNQTRAMTRLATELHRLARDVMHTNFVGLQADEHPVEAALASAAKAMFVFSTVTVCRHE